MVKGWGAVAASLTKCIICSPGDVISFCSTPRAGQSPSWRLLFLSHQVASTPFASTVLVPELGRGAQSPEGREEAGR